MKIFAVIKQGRRQEALDMMKLRTPPVFPKDELWIECELEEKGPSIRSLGRPGTNITEQIDRLIVQV